MISCLGRFILVLITNLQNEFDVLEYIYSCESDYVNDILKN